MCLVFLAYAVWLRGKIGKTISYLTACAAIFRFEVAIILLTVFISELYSKNKDRVKNLVRPAVVTFMCCVPLTIGIDSYLWNRPVWPEFEVFYFNVVLNKSHEWGTQPWCWYLQNALPSALLMAYPFAILGMFRSQVPKKIILPSLTFLSTLSYLPHKELRFMFCIIPILNLMAASSINSLIVESSRKNNFLKFLFQFGLLGLCCLAFATSLLKVKISSRNYPGGEAMVRVQEYNLGPRTKLHIDVLTAMTGCSLFSEVQKGWLFDRNENLADEEYQNYTHLLTAVPIEGFEIMDVIKGFSGVRLNLPKSTSDLVTKFPYFRILEDDKIYFMKRADVQEVAPTKNINTGHTEHDEL